MPDVTHQGWIDGHPEIGKMQKDIFDDIFDTTDDDATEENDPAPIVPTPTDFTENCSCLDHARLFMIKICSVWISSKYESSDF